MYWLQSGKRAGCIGMHCTLIFAVCSEWAHCEWARKMMAEMGKIMADMDYRNLERKMFLCKVSTVYPHWFTANPLPTPPHPCPD